MSENGSAESLDLVWTFDYRLFAQDVKQARERAGLSQAELGALIGIQSSGHLEAPRPTRNYPNPVPLIGTLVNACTVLGLYPGDYFVRIERPEPQRDEYLTITLAPNNPHVVSANVPQVTCHHSPIWGASYMGSRTLALALNILHEAAVRIGCDQPVKTLAEGDVAQAAFDHYQEFARRVLANLKLTHEPRTFEWAEIEQWLLDEMTAKPQVRRVTPSNGRQPG